MRERLVNRSGREKERCLAVVARKKNKENAKPKRRPVYPSLAYPTLP